MRESGCEIVRVWGCEGVRESGSEIVRVWGCEGMRVGLFGVGRFGGKSEHFNVWVVFTDVGTGNSLSGSKVVLTPAAAACDSLPRGKMMICGEQRATPPRWALQKCFVLKGKKGVKLGVANECLGTLMSGGWFCVFRGVWFGSIHTVSTEFW